MKGRAAYLADFVVLVICVIAFVYCFRLLARPSPPAHPLVLWLGEGISLLAGLVALVSMIARACRRRPA